MTWQEFWLDFGSNFLATLIGAIIGIGGGYFISKKLSFEESNASRLTNLKIRQEKTIDYLQIILSEVKVIDNIVQEYQREADYFKYIYLSTTFWDTLKSGGEIPNLFPPFLTQMLSSYYSKVNEANIISIKYLDYCQLPSSYLINEIKSNFSDSLSSIIFQNENGLLVKKISLEILESEETLSHVEMLIELNKLKWFNKIQNFFKDEGSPKT